MLVNYRKLMLKYIISGSISVRPSPQKESPDIHRQGFLFVLLPIAIVTVSHSQSVLALSFSERK